MSEAMTIQLSLIAHTNAGKTTLARTLLGRDVGEVRDAAHVTEIAEVHPLLALEDGTALMLWDTPGFGDTARLLTRLRNAGNPLGWLLTQVWDRFRDRPMWCSQQAVRNARDDADIVLYLVNAAENPEDARYVAMEMEILTWIGKPVVLLLNQMGPPRSAEYEKAQVEKWRTHLARFEIVGEVLALDAFARCWVQEEVLLGAIGRILAPEKQPAFARLAAAWREKNLARFDSAMAVLGRQLARAVADRETLGARTFRQQARELVQSLGLGRREGVTDKQRAMAALATRLDVDIRTATDELIALHGLEGHAAAEVLRRLQEDYAATEPVSEGYAAILGGVASGALVGLKADIAAGGLTFGAGVLAGSIVGALGGAGLARGYNLARGEKNPAVRWSAEFVVGLTRSALLRYLAVAHYGRGRGDYVQSEHPTFWQTAVSEAVEPHKAEITAIWASAKTESETAIAHSMTALARRVTRDLLRRLYPSTRAERL
jgi:hypothetical protein